LNLGELENIDSNILYKMTTFTTISRYLDK